MKKDKQTVSFALDEIGVLRGAKLVRDECLYKVFGLLLDDEVVEGFGVPNDVFHEVHV